ncbi:MAG: class II aldolase/adducin family protein [Candidatus Bathyarchaeia archaeon]
MGRSDPSASEKLKKEICRTMRRLFHRGLISSLSGNVSARFPGASEFWITPSGVFKGGLRPRDLVKVGLNGVVIEGSLKPSIETPFHAAIYKWRADVNAVVHSHNPITTALVIAGIEIKPVTVEAAVMLGEVKVVPWAPPGSEELANLISEYINGAKALVLMNHGVIGVGGNLLEAEAIVEALEETATIIFIASLFTRDISLIPGKDIESMMKKSLGN